MCAHGKAHEEVIRGAAKRILMWLQHRAKLGVTYWSPQIKGCATSSSQPDDPEKPMSARLTYSMYACADSDLSKAPSVI